MPAGVGLHARRPAIGSPKTRRGAPSTLASVETGTAPRLREGQAARFRCESLDTVGGRVTQHRPGNPVGGHHGPGSAHRGAYPALAWVSELASRIPTLQRSDSITYK